MSNIVLVAIVALLAAIVIVVVRATSRRAVNAEAERAATVLRETEARHRALLDQFPHFIFSVDRQNRYTAVNTAACGFFGRTEEQIIGKTAVELGVPPDLARVWTDQNDLVASTGRLHTFEHTTPIGNTVRTFRAIMGPMRDSTGAVVGVSGISIEMTELRAAEAVAHRLLRAVEQLDEVVFTTDRDGTITYVNPAFEAVYGFTREEAIGKTPRILNSGELTREQHAAFWAELLAGRSVRSEYRNRRKDGTLVEVIGSASPVQNDDGSISGFIAVHEDVTVQKQVAEERRRFEERVGHLARMEALGTLAGGIAHDFNNILSIILTHTTLLERRVGDAAVVARVTNTVRQAVQRGAALARQILTFARRAEVKADPVDLTQLIMELCSMISETFPRTIRVTLDLDPDLPLVQADAAQVHQALLNLCVNARDAMPSGGELTIDARVKSSEEMRKLFIDARDEDYVMISVSDTGTGIEDEHRKRIFEPFFTTKEKGKGTGLGLALVFGVVNNHGGLIDVDSRVGRGTTFRLYLPCASVAPAPAVKPAAMAAGGTERLLLIEDEPVLLESLSMQLRAHGYDVMTADNGADALEMCARSLPDAVVMDLGMPRMSATDLLRGLRELAPKMPVVAMTGYVDPEVHANVVAAGVRKIVPKPFEIGELLSALREVL
ncbi:MAG TPA: PAS domain S-box protein [Thermoanaerobaculia bacterium]|nr:PAS domain S-box protein [Thermoanaerobaculia bacterium]